MKAKPGFNIRNVCGQDLIVAEGEENIDFSNIISMNESSSYLWRAVQHLDSFTVDDMADLLLKEYEVDKQTALTDCEKLAAQWGKAGIIEGDDIPKIEIKETVIKADGSEPSEQEKTKQDKENDKPKKQSLFGKLFHKNK